MNEFLASQIVKQNNQIEKYFDNFGIEKNDYELNCVAIIKLLRTLIEHIVAYDYGMTNTIEYRIDKESLRTLVSFMKKTGLSFLSNVHRFLQAAASHYVIDEVSAPRLLNKYIPYLLDTKKWLYDKYQIVILKNIEKFFFIQLNGMEEYYKQIENKLKSYQQNEFKDNKERYYVYKSIPRFIDNNLFYETTLGIASNYASKFNRFIVFSNFKIDDRYAIKINVENDFIIINNTVIPIKVVTSYKKSIRPCEFNNFAKLLDAVVDVKSHFLEYKLLMDYMTINDIGLYDIVISDQSKFEEIKKFVLSKSEKAVIWPILVKTRDTINQNYYGSNVLKYLLANMNNVIIKDQYSSESNKHGLYIKAQPFDNYPIAMNLIGHKTSLLTLMEIFDLTDKNDELFYRKLNIKTNSEGKLYHCIDELELEEKMADSYMNSINSKLSWSYDMHVKKIGKSYYINQYERTSKYICDKLIYLSKEGIKDYSTFIDNIFTSTNYKVDSVEKKLIVRKLFENSRVACIYGPAGTGKSTLAKHISNMMNNVSKIYISNTHPAVMNMYRKIGGEKSCFMTINKYLKDKPESDLLFIDECSMVSNNHMNAILKHNLFKYLVLLGDVLQIKSIDYGPWFKINKSLLPKHCKFELTELHRTTMPELKSFWEIVRNKENVIDEVLSDNSYVKELNDLTLFEYEENQIILCLNYDGLYGVNNLNSVLQKKNNSKEFMIGAYSYRINDPVLFTENNKFSNILYNNLKGKIIDIYFNDEYAIISLNVETSINKIIASKIDGLEIIKINENNTTDISIRVKCQFDSDVDETKSELVPFQIAYAVTVHKAQGLEYNTVKIVIGENSDELVTHDIFYTAITRATKKLEIYWTFKTQSKVLENITRKTENRDIAIFANKFGYKIREKY